MIVVHPHEIARTNKFRKRACECAVNSQVAGVVGSREIGQAYPVVHRWPERPIGETIVVLLTIKRRQVHQRVLNPPFVDYSGLGCRLGSYLAAPTEPETLIGLKCFSQCNGQPPAVPLPAALGTDTRLETTTSRGKEALQDGSSRTTYRVEAKKRSKAALLVQLTAAVAAQQIDREHINPDSSCSKRSRASVLPEYHTGA